MNLQTLSERRQLRHYGIMRDVKNNPPAKHPSPFFQGILTIAVIDALVIWAMWIVFF